MTILHAIPGVYLNKMKIKTTEITTTLQTHDLEINLPPEGSEIIGIRDIILLHHLCTLVGFGHDYTEQQKES